MGGVDLSDQRVTTFSCLMKGSLWYFKISFYLLELSMSNAQIIMGKSFGNDAPAMLEFRKKGTCKWENISVDRREFGASCPHPPVSLQPRALPLPNPS